MTFTDRFERPLRDLRISVTDRCNFRCPYCMPAEIFHERYKFLARDELLSFEEIVRLTSLIVESGAVHGVANRGSEPTTQISYFVPKADQADFGRTEKVSGVEI